MARRHGRHVTVTLQAEADEVARGERRQFVLIFICVLSYLPQDLDGMDQSV